MKIFIQISIAAVVVFALSTCDRVEYKDVFCRDFELVNENYWFPNAVGDSVVFVNEREFTQTFKIADKSIVHTTKYTDNTGCTCSDVAGILLSNANDSIYFINNYAYTNNNPATKYEDVVFSLGDRKSYFFETQKTTLTTYTIGDKSFTDVVKFENELTQTGYIKSLFLVRNLGIVQFITTDGAVWTNANLTSFSQNSIDKFKFRNTTCQ